jgi:tubulin monoglycylase TTLL3/8
LKKFDPLTKKLKKQKAPKAESENLPEDLEISSLLKSWAELDPQYTCVSARNPLWILKPAGKSRGRGIQLTAQLAEILQVSGKTETMWVVQKYVENPLLIENKKFDIRQWALISQWNPLAVWFYLDCYLRFTLRDYDPVKLRDRLAHLTNNSIAKKGKEFPGVKDDTMMLSSDFDIYLKEKMGRNFQEVQNQMKKIVYWTLSCCQDTVGDRKNSFELVGFDFLVDTNFRVWLLEVNCSPDLSYSTQTTEKMVQKMFPDLVKVLVDVENFVSNDSRPRRKWGPKLLAKLDTGGFTLLKPVTRRKEENMEIPLPTQQLKVQGEKALISKNRRENAGNLIQ